MRKNINKKPVYGIERITYVMTPTGKLNQYGHPEYARKEVTKKRMTQTNFSDLKKDIYNNSKDRKDVYVKYARPTYSIYEHPKKLESVTRRFEDGHKEVSYYKPVKGK